MWLTEHLHWLTVKIKKIYIYIWLVEFNPGKCNSLANVCRCITVIAGRNVLGVAGHETFAGGRWFAASCRYRNPGLVAWRTGHKRVGEHSVAVCSIFALCLFYSMGTDWSMHEDPLHYPWRTLTLEYIAICTAPCYKEQYICLSVWSNENFKRAITIINRLILIWCFRFQCKINK